MQKELRLADVLASAGNARAFLKAMVNETLRCVGIADHHGIIRYTNPVCYHIFGMSPQEIEGRHFRELYAAGENLDRMLAESRQKGHVDNWPLLALAKDGKTVPVNVTLERVYDEDRGLLGSVALIQDGRRPQELLEELQQKELTLIRLNRSLELANLELERANRLKSEFLANTSHELRTPLNAIMGFLRLVLEGLCDGPQEEREFLENAYHSAQSLLGLINELLEGARLEAGKEEVNLGEVKVSQVFKEVEKLSRVQAAQKGLGLKFTPARGLTVRADAGKLQQILLNLVANALKFTPQGEVRVRAQAFSRKGHVRFAVEDTGIGIPKGGERNLFQKFVQGNGSTTRQYGGTGLGLAICKNLVEFMGGQIWLASPGPGQGATVSFTLPLISLKPFLWRRTEDRELGLLIKGKDGPLVLMVEDETNIIEVMERILHKYGYRTAYAFTADDGLEGARRLKPALITLDMGLPVRPGAALHSGQDLFFALQRDPETKTIPVLLVTGHAVSLDRMRERMQELPPLLTKPFRARELLDKVAEQISGKF